MSARTYAHGDKTREAIVEFVAAFHEANKYAPTLREIAAGVGLSSQSSAAYQVGELVTAGRLAVVPGVPRSIHVVTS